MLIDLETLTIGSTKNIPLEFLDSQSLPIEIFGYTIHFTLKHSIRNSDADSIFSVSKVVVNDQEAKCGRTVITIDSNDWPVISHGQYYWVVQRVDNSAVPVQIYPGEVGKVKVLSPLNSTF